MSGERSWGKEGRKGKRTGRRDEGGRRLEGRYKGRDRGEERSVKEREREDRECILKKIYFTHH